MPVQIAATITCAYMRTMPTASSAARLAARLFLPLFLPVFRLFHLPLYLRHLSYGTCLCLILSLPRRRLWDVPLPHLRCTGGGDSLSLPPLLLPAGRLPERTCKAARGAACHSAADAVARTRRLLRRRGMGRMTLVCRAGRAACDGQMEGISASISPPPTHLPPTPAHLPLHAHWQHTCLLLGERMPRRQSTRLSRASRCASDAYRAMPLNQALNGIIAHSSQPVYHGWSWRLLSPQCNETAGRRKWTI